MMSGQIENGEVSLKPGSLARQKNDDVSGGDGVVNLARTAAVGLLDPRAGKGRIEIR